MEIICIGNELLIGKVLNTNAQWMAKRATSLGILVTRVTVIRDNLDEISQVIHEALARGPRFLITTGGLGPTFDDMTLEGIAKALNQKLVTNPKALVMVKRKYESFVKSGRIEDAELTPPRVKMATLPEKAQPLPNPEGTAPGALLKAKSSKLIALPGVPTEMEAIFEESVVPMLMKESEGSTFYEASIYADNIMESSLAPLIDKTMHDNTYVYIKSHPKGEENTPHIELHFSTISKSSEEAKHRLAKALNQLSELIEKQGGKVRVQTKTER